MQLHTATQMKNLKKPLKMVCCSQNLHPWAPNEKLLQGAIRRKSK